MPKPLGYHCPNYSAVQCKPENREYTGKGLDGFMRFNCLCTDGFNSFNGIGEDSSTLW